MYKKWIHVTLFLCHINISCGPGVYHINIYYIIISVEVVSLDILWWGLGETWLLKINLKEDTVMFRLVQTLSESNNHTSSIVVLCCEKIGCTGWVTGCYLYKLKICLINMTSFQFCYNLVPDWDSWLGLRSFSWSTAAIRPLTRVTFVVSSLATEYIIKPDNFGFR
jgi:hypothetical protein